jgi:aspartate carbamoyltransferase catalytic subunit
MKTMRLDGVSWEDFNGLASGEKTPFLYDGDRPVHVLLAQQFGRKHMDALGSLATQVRFIAKNEKGMAFLRELLPHKRAMLYFSQPSTRTFLSFCAACEILGINIGEVRDTATSSEFKGESREDSVRTFSSYFDLIIMRSEIGGLAERMAWVLSNTDRPVPIINAGSGKDQHPTQALLDIYTLQRSFEQRGGIDGKKIVFVGDLARGRTVRSLSSLLTKYNEVKQCFVAPKGLQIGDDIVSMLEACGVEFELSDDFEKQVPLADAIYMTRVQDEWDDKKGDSSKIDISKYCLTVNHLGRMKPDAVIMHPFPRRSEISPEVDRDPRAVYWRQMRNGMWIRAALIAEIFGRAGKIREYYQKHMQ